MADLPIQALSAKTSTIAPSALLGLRVASQQAD